MSRACKANACVCEPLEPRQLLAGVSAAMSSGYLLIVGTPYRDRIEIRQIDGQIQATGLKKTVPASSIKAIAVAARAGNDEIVIYNPARDSRTQYMYRSTILAGGSGKDLISGGAGIDLIFGGDGEDSLYGTWGNDVIFGGWGDDYIHGGAGNDILAGDQNWDSIEGSDGNDWIEGGDGMDTLSGSNGVNYMVDDFLGAIVRNNPSGYDFKRVRPRPIPVPYYLSDNPLNQVVQTANSQSATPLKDALQGILGPQLYDAILVKKTVPNMYRTWHV